MREPIFAHLLVLFGGGADVHHQGGYPVHDEIVLITADKHVA